MMEKGEGCNTGIEILSSIFKNVSIVWKNIIWEFLVFQINEFLLFCVRISMSLFHSFDLNESTTR